MSNHVLELISDSTSTERKVEIIEEMTAQRLLNYINQKEVPATLQHIVDEVTIKRFNRLGSEGMKSTSQEGLSMTFDESDFEEFKDELDAWIAANSPKDSKGWVLYNA